MQAHSAVGKSAPGGFWPALKSWVTAVASRRTRAATAPPRAADGGSDSRPHGALRVLVVDDEPVNLMLVAAQLQARGVSPCLAADGIEAVSLACGTRFDLILMDVQMPRLDGLKATLEIRRFEARHRMPAVPVVAYSSRALSAEELQAHGMSGRLSKPCPAQELDECLNRWASEHGVALAPSRPTRLQRRVPAPRKRS